MAIRFTDDLLNNTEGTDFIVRKRRPVIAQVLLIFLAAFVAIYVSALLSVSMGGQAFFFTCLAFIVGGLAWFSTFFAQRNRDLVLATEFQNAMLASAAQLSTRFCLIAKRDGHIVYIDPGFQEVFPYFLQNDRRTIDSLLMAAGVHATLYQTIAEMLTTNTGGRLLIPFKNASNQPMPMMVTVDMLGRPKGYFLFRGRDYVEKRSEGASATPHSNLLAGAIAALPDGMILCDHNGQVAQASRQAEASLGYGADEMRTLGVTLEQLCYQYEGLQVGKLAEGQFSGVLTLQRKNRTLVSFDARQTPLIENGAPTGICIFLTPQGGEDKKKITPPPSSEAPAGAGSLMQFIASSPLAIACLTIEGSVLACNQPLRSLMKSHLPEADWSFLDIVREESRAEVKARLTQLMDGKPADTRAIDIKLMTEEPVVTASLYLNRLGEHSPFIIAQIIDTTEQRNLEQRFAHSQKMQAVGQLAGGIAHDFNNLLTAMIGFCDLLLIRHPAGDQSFADIMQVKQNANRAANLVRQLLAFSRRQTLQPKMLDITDVLAELSNLIRRLIGENIELKVVHGRDLGLVKADQGQLEQVFINLAVNARDAMHKGGQLTVRTSHVSVDRKHPVGRSLVPPVEDEAIVDGDYVLVEVIDTGTGIPKKLLQKIFEPFFSTKEVGSGTGLGLATVYGIIKQTGGYIYVSSKEGMGTTFSLFFKRHLHEAAQPAEAIAAAPAATDDLTGKGTVLLVEDETPVRAFAARALRNKGYTVLEADCGETAIEVMDAQGSEVDVIVTDVIMPGINGPTMIETVAPKFPQVKVIFISGYAEDIFVNNYGTEREFNFLPKPFTLKQLASKVKEVIQK